MIWQILFYRVYGSYQLLKKVEQNIHLSTSTFKKKLIKIINFYLNKIKIKIKKIYLIRVGLKIICSI
jgi:hypothetical protein